MKTKNLLGKYVKFLAGRKLWFGRVTSIEQDIANIKGMEQKKRSRPAYHYLITEIRECTHDEVFMLGGLMFNDPKYIEDYFEQLKTDD